MGGDAALTTDPCAVDAAQAVVLPGVGAFGRCMEALRESGLENAALGAIAQGKPFLGICVGMQMLYDWSEEDPDVKGMGVIPGAVRLLPGTVKRPQMQWNRLDVPHPQPRMFDGLGGDPWVYFVHSYAAEPGIETVATCDYGGPVTAAVERGRLWATQFHPEKSGAAGLRILENFVRAVSGD